MLIKLLKNYCTAKIQKKYVIQHIFCIFFPEICFCGAARARAVGGYRFVV